MSDNAVKPTKINDNSNKVISTRMNVKAPQPNRKPVIKYETTNNDEVIKDDFLSVNEIKIVPSVFFKQNRGRILEEVRIGIAYLIKNKATSVAFLKPFRGDSDNLPYTVLLSSELARRRGEILSRVKEGETFILKSRETTIAMLCPPPIWTKGDLTPEEMLKLLLTENLSVEELKRAIL